MSEKRRGGGLSGSQGEGERGGGYVDESLFNFEEIALPRGKEEKHARREGRDFERSLPRFSRRPGPGR